MKFFEFIFISVLSLSINANAIVIEDHPEFSKIMADYEVQLKTYTTRELKSEASTRILEASAVCGIETVYSIIVTAFGDYPVTYFRPVDISLDKDAKKQRDTKTALRTPTDFLNAINGAYQYITTKHQVSLNCLIAAAKGLRSTQLWIQKVDAPSTNTAVSNNAPKTR